MFWSEWRFEASLVVPTPALYDSFDIIASIEDIMASLHVRKLDDEIVARLKRRAARHGRSAEAEHREILRQALANEVDMSWDEMAALSRELTKGRVKTPSEVLIREDRDRR